MINIPGAGGLFSKLSGFDTNLMEMEYNSAEAMKNRDFQKEMSNTQYQRGMADMRKAGLNPIAMMSMGGAGASSPSGSQASASLKQPKTIDAMMAMSNTALTASQIANNRHNLKIAKDNDSVVGEPVKSVMGKTIRDVPNAIKNKIDKVTPKSWKKRYYISVPWRTKEENKRRREATKKWNAEHGFK